MRRILLIISGFLLLIGQRTIAQDIHYSQFDFIPTYLNPALSGLDHDMKLGLIYRDQGLRVTNNSYKSFTAFIDGPTYRGMKNGNHGGVGFSLLRDVAGVGGLETIEGLINMAYHFGLDDEGKQFLSFAPQYAFIQRSIADEDAFLFEEEINGGVLTEDLGSLSRQYHDLNLGVSYRLELGENQYFQLGYGFHHLNNSDTISLGIIQKLSARHNAFAKADIGLGEKLCFEPRVQYQHSEVYRELIFQGNFGVYVNQEKQSKINVGLGYRTKDAVEFLLGWENKNYEIGIAYDVNTSSLNRVSTPAAGLEVGIKYRWPVNRNRELLFIPFIEKIGFTLDVPDRIFVKQVEVTEGIPILDPYTEDDEIKEEEIAISERPNSTSNPVPPALPFENAALGDGFALDKIYYDFDDDGILPASDTELYKLLKVLNDYPTMRIQLNAHTDARGDDLYNQDLSERRALAAKKWLIEKGIDASRLESAGYGETLHVNDCRNGVKCSEQQHRKNRRTEFKILNQ